MSILKLVTAPDPLLYKKSEEIKEITNDIKKLANDMLETMYHYHGIGLAAVQVGHLLSLIVVDIAWADKNTIEKNDQYIMINPKIIEKSDKLDAYNEGCLSFPKERIKITRPENITVEYLDINGKAQQVTADGLFAKCIQHEVDHTNGITIEDGLSAFKKQMMHARIKKNKKFL